MPRRSSPWHDAGPAPWRWAPCSRRRPVRSARPTAPRSAPRAPMARPPVSPATAPRVKAIPPPVSEIGRPGRQVPDRTAGRHGRWRTCQSDHESHGPGARSRPAPGRRRLLRLPARASGYGQARRDRDGPRRAGRHWRLAGHRGAWDKNVPACNQCHGPGGIGVGDNFPALAGQSAAYISGQLRAWRQGQRPPGPLGLMPAVATRLTDAEIDAVSAYYAGLPQAAEQLAAQAAAPGAKQ